MAKFHLPTIEEEQLAKWDERKVLKQVFERSKDGSRKPFVFFEGPPTANGKPGIHHLLARSFKDVLLRFKTMQGYRIDRKAGWDTHGLPVELEVEKQLGFTKKQDIEQFGISAFNAKCRESVWKYLDLWQKSTRRVAFWVDMENPYITYKNDFVESLWSIFKEIDKKRLLYKGYRVTPHCPRCVTSLSSHELAQGYKNTEDPSVFVKFPAAGRKNTFYLVWTTTPWTLSANVALAVGPKVVYVEAKMKETGEVLILAEERLSVLDGAFDIVKKGSWESDLFSGTLTDDFGRGYEPLYGQAMPENEQYKNHAYRIYPADFVSTGDGTGIVHIAPAFGEDDATLGRKASLPTLLTVDTTGMVTSDSPGKGKFFKKADEEVKADLTARGLLYKSGTIVHSYPFCWRCDTPVLYYAKSSWYVRMSSLRDQLIANNNQINWVPSHIKDGRFGEWLKDVKDWAISRERYWGTPLPVWQCESCEKTRVIGGFDEMDAAAPLKNNYFLQRHGEALSNVGEYISSIPELKPDPLTEKGREQVVASAKLLKEKKIDLIFASDILRTKETAEIISKEVGVSVIYDDRLHELAVGAFNGKSIAEYHKAHEGMDRFEQAAEGCESHWDVRRRMVAFFKDIDAKYRGKNIVIVSHGDPLWLLQTAFKELTKQEVRDWPHYNHTGQFVEMTSPRNLPYDTLGMVDVHRPFIDDVQIVCECSGTMRRVPDVADVWFDSGAMPYAQWHYPFENADRIDSGANFPADYISEAIDQTRGWFYTLLAVSTLLGKTTPPYKNVICLGHVLDGKGKKMSKSKGNVVDPFEAMDKYGADVIRYYLFTVNQPGEAKRFDEKAVDEVTKKVFLILWNVLTYYKMYAGEGAAFVDKALASPKHELDAWILSETSRLVASVTAQMEAYDVTGACRELGAFVNDLSTWYVRRSRDRFKAGGAEAAEAVATLGYVLGTFAKLTAPFTPFLAESLYAELGGKADSVHLLDWPDAEAAKDRAAATEELRNQMKKVRSVCSLGLEKRAAASMPVRQALASATVRGKGGMTDWMKEIVADELNVHEVRSEESSGDTTVEIDTVLTPALKREGAARDLVRNVNDLRKTSGLTLQDRVTIVYYTASDFWKETVAEHGAGVMADTLATKIEEGQPYEPKSLWFEDHEIHVAIVKQ